ncbi:MAG: hypothetical protein HY901_06590 [Deltaproteobacteria bacterium]|nr:hypothetical protein [Deltaproteobacteria bacterium]
MLTFFCGRPDAILEALEDSYSDSYERLFSKKSSVVDMSRWVNLEGLEGLLERAAELSGVSIPKLVDSLTNEGWSRDEEGKRIACVVVKEPLVRSLASIPPAVASKAAAEWAERLGPPADDSVRYPLRVRAEEFLTLFRSCKKDKKIVVMGYGGELPVDLEFEAGASPHPQAASTSSDIAFFAGDARHIGEALEDGHEGKLTRATAESADFSFHLGMGDLDALALECANAVGKPAIPLSESIERCVAGDATQAWRQREWSADVLRKQWVERWSGLTEERVDEVGRKWISRFEGAEPTPLLEAVRALARVCRAAGEKGLDVVFTWRAG